MAESLICTAETKKLVEGSLFQRRIEFHPARKPFLGFSNGGADFHLETLNPTSDFPNRSGTNVCSSSGLAVVKKVDGGGDIFEFGFDPELNFGVTVRRIGAGLQNLGNTCFLNSVLQCLTYTEPFAAYLQSGKHKSSCHTAGFCAMCAIQNHVKRALQSTGSILAPKDLVMNLRCISRNFRNARQEDAHEYMVNLLESMHKCCLPSGVPTESPSAYEKSLVHKIFGGRLRSQVKCMQCSYCSNTFDPFLDLSLEIAKADSVRKAMLHFTASEQLDGGEKQYHCERCKQKVKALKQLTVHKAPYVLSIHLKRFSSHSPGQKIDKKIAFDTHLDLKPFVSGSYDGDLKYTLYGVLVHAGWSTHSGHYYCYVRTSSGMWHSLDDNRVVQVSEKIVLAQKAYMLFYVRNRRNLIPRKPAEVARKENISPSSVSTTSMKETVPDCSLLEGLNTVSSLGVHEIVGLGRGSLEEPQLKEASIQKNEGPFMSEDTSVQVKDPVLIPSTNKAIPSQNLPKTLPEASFDIRKEPGLNPSPEAPASCQLLPECLVQSSLGDSGPSSHTIVATGSAENNPSHHGSRKKNNIPDAVLIDSGPEKVAKKEAKPELNSTMYETVGEAPCETISDLKTEKDSLIKLFSHLSTGSNQNEIFSSECTQSEQPGKNTVDKGLTSKKVGLIEASSQDKVLKQRKKDMKFSATVIPFDSKLLSGCVLSEQPGTNIVEKGLTSKKVGLVEASSQDKVLKPKKKVMKFSAGVIPFGSKLLFRKSLSLRKKKKLKRNKRISKELKDSTQDDLEPSTSEKTEMDALDLSHSRTKNVRSFPKRGKDYHDAENLRDSDVKSGMNTTEVDRETNTVTNKKEGDFRERLSQKNAVLATTELSPPLKSTSLTPAAQKQDPIKRDTSKEMNKALFNMLTRGSQSTIARWDGTHQVLGSNNAQDLRIGYVLDEWDEELDCGKKRKLRNKVEFGGPNPFQEVAMERVKMNKIRSGHQPLSIKKSKH
ncbi:hypothetical protein GIB67_035851 [Kingdonia uniflora]|uniref:Ubiquitin carboxyl-terminal hydrolase n=1 Tax=Kingdonia uniflora TaxID=39325 RepID=A0A7J7MJY7_9MAGN|nr:hypothetical protein GIB67_035851 [Kingdonia uniflora]